MRAWAGEGSRGPCQKVGVGGEERWFPTFCLLTSFCVYSVLVGGQVPQLPGQGLQEDAVQGVAPKDAQATGETSPWPQLLDQESAFLGAAPGSAQEVQRWVLGWVWGSGALPQESASKLRAEE